MKEQNRQRGPLYADLVFYDDANVPSEASIEVLLEMANTAAIYFQQPDAVLETIHVMEVVAHYGGQGKHRIEGSTARYLCSRGGNTRGNLPTMGSATGRLWVRFLVDDADLRWLFKHWNPESQGDYASATEWWAASKTFLLRCGLSADTANQIDVALHDS